MQGRSDLALYKLVVGLTVYAGEVRSSLVH